MRSFTLPETTLVLLITAVLSLVANALSSNIPFLDAVPGMVILIVISLAGIVAARVLPGGIPAVAYITTLGCILTYPGFPGSEIVNMYQENRLADRGPGLRDLRRDLPGFRHHRRSDPESAGADLRARSAVNCQRPNEKFAGKFLLCKLNP